MLWFLYGYNPAVIFPWIYGISFCYILLRSWQHYVLVNRVAKELQISGICHVLPSFHWFHWQFVIESEDCFYTGKIIHRQIQLEASYPKEEKNTIILATMGIDGVRAFLRFAQRIHVTCKEVADGYEVSWSDVRFSYGRKLPFGVDVRLDREMNVISERIGWRKKSWEPPFV